MKETKDTMSVPSYPLVGFSNALEVARAVSEAGGAKADVQKALIASHLQTSHTSGAFLQRLASARSYRMIEGRGSYRLTPEGVSYFLPATQGDSKRALLSFLSSPPAFSDIIKRFDGTKLPSVDMLANVLHREINVPESWKGRIASFFIKAAQSAGALDSQGFLRYRAGLQTMETQPQRHSNEPAPHLEPPTPSASPPAHQQFSEGKDALIFSVGDQTVRLETPKGDLSRPLWEKLNKFVKALEPSENK